MICQVVHSCPLMIGFDDYAVYLSLITNSIATKKASSAPICREFVVFYCLMNFILSLWPNVMSYFSLGSLYSNLILHCFHNYIISFFFSLSAFNRLLFFLYQKPPCSQCVRQCVHVTVHFEAEYFCFIAHVTRKRWYSACPLCVKI